MNKIVLALYWAVYIVAGIIIQQQVPGTDALVPGFLIALQSGRKKILFWLFILFVLIQEGGGSLHFGSSLLWYGGQIAIYYIASYFVSTNSFFATLMLAGLFSAYGALVKIFICAIQDIPVNYQYLLETSLIQAAIIPIIWLLAFGLRKRMFIHAPD